MVSKEGFNEEDGRDKEVFVMAECLSCNITLLHEILILLPCAQETKKTHTLILILPIHQMFIDQVWVNDNGIQKIIYIWLRTQGTRFWDLISLTKIVKFKSLFFFSDPHRLYTSLNHLVSWSANSFKDLHSKIRRFIKLWKMNGI